MFFIYTSCDFLAQLLGYFLKRFYLFLLETQKRTGSPNCLKQPRTEYPFHRFFYPTICVTVSGDGTRVRGLHAMVETKNLFWEIYSSFLYWTVQWNLVLRNKTFFVHLSFYQLQKYSLVIGYSFERKKISFLKSRFTCTRYVHHKLFTD